jgi:hypothetical protein
MAARLSEITAMAKYKLLSINNKIIDMHKAIIIIILICN